MKTLTLSLFALMLSLPAIASMEDIYAKQYGTCTKETCPAGVKVVVDVTKDDTGYTMSPDGQQVNLLDLRGVTFHVDREDEKCQQCSIVTTSTGKEFSIQRIFLKKTT